MREQSMEETIINFLESLIDALNWFTLHTALIKNRLPHIYNPVLGLKDHTNTRGYIRKPGTLSYSLSMDKFSSVSIYKNCR